MHIEMVKHDDPLDVIASWEAPCPPNRMDMIEFRGEAYLVVAVSHHPVNGGDSAAIVKVR